MGTQFRVVLQHTDQSVAHSVIADALDQAVSVDQQLSEWKADSPLSALNAGAGGPAAPLPQPTFDALTQAVAWADRTDGAFDPTWAALWGLWRFEDGATPPSSDALQARVAKVGWRRLELDKAARTARLAEPGMAVGLGAIGKGIALERMGAQLRQAGVDHYAIEAGGQWLVSAPEGAQPWTVEVRHPRDPGALKVLQLQTGSVATSGDYERFFEHEGVRYHHLLDPRTGLPARHLQSISVWGPDPVAADVLSTACFVAGMQACAPWLAEAGLQAVWVDARGDVSESGDAALK